jgi:hypothetical protein
MKELNEKEIEALGTETKQENKSFFDKIVDWYKK